MSARRARRVHRVAPPTLVWDATRTAAEARAEIKALRALSPAEAVERIEQNRAAEQAKREAADHALRERQRQLRSMPSTRDSDLRQDGPALGR